MQELSSFAGERHLTGALEPLLCPSACSVTLRFSVGQEYVVCSMKFPANANVEKQVQQFFDAEHIPVYLHVTILSALAALFAEEWKNVLEEKLVSGTFSVCFVCLFVTSALHIDSRNQIISSWESTLRETSLQWRRKLKAATATDDNLSKNNAIFIRSFHRLMNSSREARTTLLQVNIFISISLLKV